MRGLLVGRFQPFHRGHLEIVRKIRGERPDDPLILAIGSAQESYTWENPFTASERFDMIRQAAEEANLARIEIVPVPDIHQHALWVRYLEELLPPFDRIYTNNPLTESLFRAASYDVVNPTLFDRTHLEGAKVRAALAVDREWEKLVPPAVVKILVKLEAVGRLRLLAPGLGHPVGSEA